MKERGLFSKQNILTSAIAAQTIHLTLSKTDTTPLAGAGFIFTMA